jgi:hypothetical protein
MRLEGTEEAALGAAKVSRNGRAKTDPPRRRKERRVVEWVWKDMKRIVLNHPPQLLLLSPVSMSRSGLISTVTLEHLLLGRAWALSHGVIGGSGDSVELVGSPLGRKIIFRLQKLRLEHSF